MNFGTKLRSVLVIATCLNTALMATDVTEFGNPTLNLIYKVASIVLNFVIVFCATYFNNDYTPAAAEGTGHTRALKSGIQYDEEPWDGENGEDEEGTIE